MGATYIYGIRDLEIDKFIYVGKGNEPLGRFSGHMRCSDNEGIRKLVEEKGQDNFYLEMLEAVKFEVSRDWIRREKFWITKLRKEGHPLCNKNDGGGGVTEHTEETKDSLSKAKMGHEVTEETRAKQSRALMGREVTEETRAKLSKALSGDNNPRGMLGKHHTEEAKAKQSEANTGREVTKETKAKLSERMSGENNPRGFLGKHHTEETKARTSKANSNPSDETRRRMSETSSGNENSAKSYPAFYNIKTKRYIPAGRNLARMCREYELTYLTMSFLSGGRAKQARDGWRLAAEKKLLGMMC